MRPWRSSPPTKPDYVDWHTGDPRPETGRARVGAELGSVVQTTTPLKVIVHYVMRGSRRSRTRSPRRLMASTVSKIAMPGKVESHQATLIYTSHGQRLSFSER